MALYSLLDDRCILSLTGKDVKTFLQGITTNDIDKLQNHHAQWTGILSPQGKYLFDFFLYQKDDVLFLDCNKNEIENLIDTLKKYKLRSDVIINKHDDLSVAALWNLEQNFSTDLDIKYYIDPRKNAMEYRLIASKDILENLKTQNEYEEGNYKSHRIKNAVADLAFDVPNKDIFWLEANAEQLNGVDFSKGCYVGQEVTARMKHKSELKKSIVSVKLMGFAQTPCPMATDIQDIGTLLCCSGANGLALVRLDRWQHAITTLRSVMAGDCMVLKNG
jgi:folate-binding protein YgfZ